MSLESVYAGLISPRSPAVLVRTAGNPLDIGLSGICLLIHSLYCGLMKGASRLIIVAVIIISVAAEMGVALGAYILAASDLDLTLAPTTLVAFVE